jgi:membrane-associated phospholipid phosphatase
MSRRAVTIWGIVAVLSGLSFGELLREVVTRSGLTGVDPSVASFIAGHRTGWLAALLGIATWAGSAFVIVPLGLAIGGYLFFRYRTWLPLVQLAVAFGGAAASYGILKPIVGRVRPGAGLQYGPLDEGWAFPSGHSTQAVSFYGILAVVLISQLWPNRRWSVALTAAAIALVVLISRLYLGVHWLTDILGGLTLGLTWVAIAMLVTAAVESWRARRTMA